MGSKQTCLITASTISIVSRTLGSVCLSLNYLCFNFRGSPDEGRKKGKEGQIQPFPLTSPFYTQGLGWVGWLPFLLLPAPSPH